MISTSRLGLFSRAVAMRHFFRSMPRQFRHRAITGFIFTVGILALAFSVLKLSRMDQNLMDIRSRVLSKRPPVVWIHGKKINSGYLDHVIGVFERLGFIVGDENSNWNVLWSHEYPFFSLMKHLKNLSPQQKVNHFPGSGYITNKLNLITESNFSFIPRAFSIPKDKLQFQQYALQNPKKLFVRKGTNHRGIQIQKTDEIDSLPNVTFIQEFVHNPFLIEGYKFDIGIYVIITSVNPLRVYAFMGDVLFRVNPHRSNKMTVNFGYIQRIEQMDVKRRATLGLSAPFFEVTSENVMVDCSIFSDLKNRKQQERKVSESLDCVT